MKKQNSKKLLFIKETVQELTVDQQLRIVGGGDDGPATGKTTSRTQTKITIVDE